MHRRQFIVAGLFATAAAWLAWAAPVFDPTLQPVGYAGAYVLSKPGVADGNAKAFRPLFNSTYWSGDITRHAVSSVGDISSTSDWTAAGLLAAAGNSNRLIFTRLDDAVGSIPAGSAVEFKNYNNLSANQKTLLGSQAILDFIRGSRSGEGTIYRQRAGILGDILHSNLVYVDYAPAGLDNNDRLYVGANDGMLHAFNAGTGDEVFAYIPSSLFPTLSKLSATDYNANHRYYVDGGIAVADVVFPSDNKTHKVLVSGLGAGGQAYFALDITDGAAADINAAKRKLLWEVNDRSTGLRELGFSYSLPSIVKVRSPTGSKPAVIVGNGYVSTFPDGTPGSGAAYLLVLDIETGSLIRAISTGAGSGADINGLSSPRAVDVDADGITDYVYAGDLNGNLWRFDLRDTNSANWNVSFSGRPLFTAKNKLGEAQSITVQPAVVPHPGGGSIVLFGTGRMLNEEDLVGQTNGEIQSVYGIRDRFNDTVADASTLVVQEFSEHIYTDPKGGGTAPVRVRTSSNVIVPKSADGWLIDLEPGERVITPVQTRSGRVMLTTTNPLFDDQANWLVEANYLTGGTPDVIVFDMNKDNTRDANDNVDANGDGDRLDLIDRVTGIFQGTGVVSGATLAVLSAAEGTFYINQQPLLQPASTPAVEDLGVAGGHFDEDTSSFISPINSGTTDGHIHQYDDKFNVTGVDFFNVIAPPHKLTLDITDPNQRFKLIVVNAALSTGGRFSINKTYSATDPSSYVKVTDYASTAVGALPLYSLGGVAGTTKLTQLSMFFDRNVLLDGGLIPTQTGCVRSNQPGFKGEWRNGALTVWAAPVDEAGRDQFTLIRRASDQAIVGITGKLLWENTLFWHWKGPCYTQDLQSAFTAPDGTTTTLFEYYKRVTAADAAAKDAAAKEKKRKKGGKETVGSNITPLPPATPPPPSSFERRVESLSNPDRVSWKERFQ